MNKTQAISLFDNLSKGCKPSFLADILKPSGKHGQYLSEDYMHANCILTELLKACVNPVGLSEYKDLRKNLSPDVLYRLKYNKICLAARIDELKAPAQEEVRESRDWIYTEKIPGVRAMLVIRPNEKPSLFGRFTDVDCGLINYTNKFHYATALTSIPHALAMDVELFFAPNVDETALANILTPGIAMGEATNYIPTTKDQLCASLFALSNGGAVEIQQDYLRRTGRSLLTMYLLHPLFYEGVDYFNRSIEEGQKILPEICTMLQEARLPCRAVYHSGCGPFEKKAFLDRILQAGGEGIVAYNLKALYTGGRNKNTWVKIKANSDVNLTDTIDGFVTGFDSNDKVVTHLEVSIFIPKSDHEIVHKIARVPLSKTQSAAVTELVVTSPVLKAEIYNNVVELAGTHFDTAGKLVAAKLVRFRSDKTSKDCVIEESYIECFTKSNGTRYVPGSA